MLHLHYSVLFLWLLKLAAAQTSMSMEEAELDGLEPEEIYEALFEAEPSSAPEAEGESGWDELVHKFLPARDIMQRTLQGYARDIFFQSLRNIKQYGLYKKAGFYYRESAEGREQLVIPNDADLRRDILYEVHDQAYSGHPGIKRTQFNLKREYW